MPVTIVRAVSLLVTAIVLMHSGQSGFGRGSTRSCPTLPMKTSPYVATTSHMSRRPCRRPVG